LEGENPSKNSIIPI